ncbi:hypothetical protein JQN72_14335 [Phycicoccus sp. CSK15P-2]|uniref:hypothetical protein n=1 Tax=Phycicoccus sp. CSK15P-2 TaxID=2807627 RepID=UPI00194E8FC7|nr:hypothetical protein [Phycicoccus sp. CSK15P-2]MBM6405420.1 hypothetical protein [Phycicoccus sp. CSK15P-2]
MLVQELHPERGVALAGAIGLLLFGGILLVFLIPFVRGVVVGLRTGDWWSPFAGRASGNYGPMAASRFFAVFRAPEPKRRTTAGLVTRWVVWTVVVAGLAYYPVYLAVLIARAF